MDERTGAVLIARANQTDRLFTALAGAEECMLVEIVRGAAAHRLLCDESFLKDWEGLRDGCPSASEFSFPKFSCAWYRAYQRRFEPVLALARNPRGGQVAGVMPLALGADRHLVGAGAWQAEYQSWACAPEISQGFPARAIDLLQQAFGGTTIRLCYLPAATPLGSIAQLASPQSCLLQHHRRLVMRFGDGSRVEASLNKRGNKNRLRRLGKIGPIALEEITDRHRLAMMFELAVRWYDARQLALRGAMPFARDAFKKPFHRALINLDGVLHATALMAGQRVASLHLNIRGCRHVQLWFIAHDPCLAECSPGKLHVLFLARMLRQQGMEYLDLTPGDDPYKERFATDADEVHSLTIYPTAVRRGAAQLGSALEKTARRALHRFDLTPANALSAAKRLIRKSPRTFTGRVLRGSCQWIASRNRRCVFACNASAAVPSPEMARLTREGSRTVRRDALEDLLAYDPRGGQAPLAEFVADAFDRMEHGQSVYTCVEAGRLVHWGWLIEHPDRELLARILPEAPMSDRSAVIANVYTRPEARRRGLASECLRKIVDDVRRSGCIDWIYLPVPDDNRAALRLVEKLGLRCQHVVHEWGSFGRLHSRVEAAPVFNSNGARPLVKSNGKAVLFPEVRLS